MEYFVTYSKPNSCVEKTKYFEDESQARKWANSKRNDGVEWNGKQARCVYVQADKCSCVAYFV